MKVIVTLLTIILFTSCLCSYQTLDTIWEYESENFEDDFGKNITSLDFNGDGYDDLFVATGGVIAIENDSLRIVNFSYYFEGNQDGLPNTYTSIINYSLPETIPDTISFYEESAFVKLTSLGDVNNDGYEDLGFRSIYSNSYSSYWGGRINIVYGNNYNDFEIDYSLDQYHQPVSNFKGLGDINGDGYDDMGYNIGSNVSGFPISFWIIDGQSLEEYTIPNDITSSRHFSIDGLGDINGDGFGDYSYSIRQRESVVDEYGSTRWYTQHKIFLGSSLIDSLADYSFTTKTQGKNANLLKVNDFNGDGYDDILLSDYELNEVGSSGLRLWLGGQDIDFTQYSHIEYYEWLYNYSCDDINNDGYSDIICTRRNYSSGYIYGCLGGINGTWDIYQTFQDGFGWDMTSGDFNNDGQVDLVVGSYDTVSAPWQPGKLIMLATSNDLTEIDPEINTEIESEDHISTQPIIIAYPNPFNPEITFEFTNIVQDAIIEIYNIKGQHVKSINVEGNSKKKTINFHNHPSGIYFYRVYINDELIKTNKFTLIK